MSKPQFEFLVLFYYFVNTNAHSTTTSSLDSRNDEEMEDTDVNASGDCELENKPDFDSPDLNESVSME